MTRLVHEPFFATEDAGHLNAILHHAPSIPLRETAGILTYIREIEEDASAASDHDPHAALVQTASVLKTALEAINKLESGDRSGAQPFIRGLKARSNEVNLKLITMGDESVVDTFSA